MRKNGLIIDSYGTKRWYLNDKLHRIDGPAVEYEDGSKEWWINGGRVDAIVHFVRRKEFS